jgi:hypothetical protein
MSSGARGKFVVGVAAVVGLALIQGCAVTTGVYVPDRSDIVSHSMTSRFDQSLNMRYAMPTGGLASGSALHMPHERQSGALFFHY